MSLKDILKGLINKQAANTSASDQSKNASSVRAMGKARSSGIATQFAGVGPSASHKQLVIGLDFGTAFTKVVVGEERLRIAIPLRGRGEKTSDYLLPTVFWSTQEGLCSIDSPQGEQHADLKMSLLEGNFEDSAIQSAATYLALVLRRVRAFIFDNKQGVYGANYIDWLVNVGLPTSSYHDERLTNLYKRMIITAWFASASEGEVSEQSIKEAWKNSSTEEKSGASERDLHWEAVSIFPEFVAQVTGYIRSPLRQSDMHLLVDVGAGTLDATIFNVHEVEGEDKFPIFAKAVERLGTRFLVRSRIKGRGLKEEKELAPFARVPKKTEFASLLGIDVATLQRNDLPFTQRVIEAVGSLLRYTKGYRYPLSRRWEGGVPVFLCGGGAGCDFYAEIFLSENGNFSGFPVKSMKLPKPDQLEANGLREDDYDRVSVAYGLSFDPFDIGEIIKEDDVDDVPTEEGGSNSLGATSSSVMCSRCGGSGGLHRTCDACGGSGFMS